MDPSFSYKCCYYAVFGFCHHLSQSIFTTHYNLSIDTRATLLVQRLPLHTENERLGKHTEHFGRHVYETRDGPFT